MGKKSQRRQKSAGQNTKNQQRKRKKLSHSAFKKTPSVFHNQKIQDSWDNKKTLLQNYKQLGLISDVNGSFNEKPADAEPEAPVVGLVTEGQLRERSVSGHYCLEDGLTMIRIWDNNLSCDL
jgi:hypothetical protein